LRPLIRMVEPRKGVGSLFFALRTVSEPFLGA
jgi:hypothetical protein